MPFPLSHGSFTLADALSTYTSRELLPFWLGTYAVLLLSWLMPCTFFEALERTGATTKYRLQPNKSPLPDSMKAKALKMAGLNWCWLPFALLVAAPLFQLRFPLSTPSSWWSMYPAQLVASFVVDDIWFYGWLSIQYITHASRTISFIPTPPPLLPLNACRAFAAYHRYLHEHPKLYVLYHKPHHVFTAPCAWTSHAVHPVEMLLQR